MTIRLLLLIVMLVGCEPRPISVVRTSMPSSSTVAVVKNANAPAPEAAPIPKQVNVPTTRVAIGQNIWIETVKNPEQALAGVVSDALAGLGTQLSISDALSSNLPRQPAISWQSRTAGIERRVILELEVVLARGYLEHLISRFEAGKDHESILSSKFDAEVLYTALHRGAGLQPGKPAKFLDENREADFKPATGEVVKIYFDYVNPQGKIVVVPAQSWVISAKDGKAFTADWVFAGSFKGKSTTAMGEEQVYFAANDGRVVCLANFNSALLDLPFESVRGDPTGDSLGYKANTEAIPERGTKVRAIFEPVPKSK